MSSMKYPEGLKYLERLRQRGVKPGLDRIKELLSRAGNPHHDYPSVLVGGTNGKGSVCYILSSILKECGYKTGTHIKPHIYGPEERAKISGKSLSRDKFSEYLSQLKSVAEKADTKVSYFEMTAALALFAFSRKNVDIAVVEVGLGGRLDATNALDPDISVLTNVSPDHTDRLGEDIFEIARDKADISREGKPFVINSDKEDIIETLKDFSQKRDALIRRVDKIMEIENKKEGISFSCDSFTLESVNPGMNGDFQIENTATALTVCRELKKAGWELPESGLQQGIEKTYVPGRFEIVRENPLTILDGAHNPAAAGALSGEITEFDNTPSVAMMAIMKNKDQKEILRELKEAFDIFIFVPVNNARSEDPETLKRKARQSGIEKVHSLSSVKSGFRKAGKLSGNDGLICITGSIYLVAEIKKIFDL